MVLSDECYVEFTWAGDVPAGRTQPGRTILEHGTDGVVAVHVERGVAAFQATNTGEWVEFQDALGRTRTCMKKDLPELQRRDEELEVISRERAEPQQRRQDDEDEVSNKSLYSTITNFFSVVMVKSNNILFALL